MNKKNYGILLEKKKAPTHIQAIVIANGRMIRKRLTPAAFIAVSSNFSPKFPNVINDASNIAKGRANGTTEVAAYTKNSANTFISTPLPTKSLTCSQTNCISRIKTHIKKVIANSPRKFLSK